MKYLKSTAILLLMLGLSATVFAQPGQQRRALQDRPGPGWSQRGDLERPVMRLPDLTDGQRERIRQLHLEQREAMLPLQNQIGEKRAHLRTLTTGEEPDRAAANRIIEEMGALRTEMMKLRLEHRMEVRGLLTDEQRIIFDSMPARGGRMDRPMGRRRPGRG